MKDRLPALDGLRGFAALSVVLGHAGLISLGIGNIPLVLPILTFLSSAHNAVQILFVLSGFLMAYLYPSIPSIFYFLKKRYGRIFPIYIVVVVFIWVLKVLNISEWYLQALLLFLIAVVGNSAWKILEKSKHSRKFTSIVFVGFLVIQVITILINIFIAPKLYSLNAMSSWQERILVLITNLTLTEQFIKQIHSLSGVFWSLGVEMLFYITYPFIAIPLIHVSKKRSYIFSIFVIVCVTKILLDLDNALTSIYALNGMNIARANGFVAGVTIGTIYQTKGTSWNLIKKYVGNKFFGFFALLILIGVQLAESIVGLGSIGFMNMFYLITSWLIALVILNAIIPNSLTHKIFSKKTFTFLGLISYSLYLIHQEIMVWAEQIGKYIEPLVQNINAHQLISIVLVIFISVIVSAFLFKVVESIYFSSKKKAIATTQASYSEKNKYSEKRYLEKGRIAGVIIIITFIVFIYSGNYSPTLLVHREGFNVINPFNAQEIPLLSENFEKDFIAKENNLSVIGIDLRYEKSAGLTIANKKESAILRFDLYDSNRLIFTSSRSAYVIEGSPRFQFGFPEIINSKGKKYKVKLSLIYGKTDDTIFVVNYPESFISIYKVDKKNILENPLRLVFNRLDFILSDAGFAFFGAFLVALLGIYIKKPGMRKGFNFIFQKHS